MCKKTMCVLLLFAGGLMLPADADGGLFGRCGRRGILRRIAPRQRCPRPCAARTCRKTPYKKRGPTGYTCPQMKIGDFGTYCTYHAMRCYNPEADQPTTLYSANCNLGQGFCDSTSPPCQPNTYKHGCSSKYAWGPIGDEGLTDYPGAPRWNRGVKVLHGPTFETFETENNQQVRVCLYWIRLDPTYFPCCDPRPFGIGHEVEPDGDAADDDQVTVTEVRPCAGHCYELTLSNRRLYGVLTHKDTE